MLPERVTELLSAYVDGEISARERKHVTRLLRKSVEARQLLHKLKKDSMILRMLPRKKTQLDLSASAMGTISLRGLKIPKVETAPAPVAASKPRRRSSAFLLAVAVVVVLALGLGSFLVVRTYLDRHDHVNGQPDTHPAPPAPGTERERSLGTEPIDDTPPVIAVVHEAEPPLPATAPEPKPKTAQPGKENRVGVLAPRIPPFVTAQPRLMLILPLKDLDQTAGSARLVEELKKDNASRLDLFCTVDTARSLERLQARFKAANIAFRIDAYSQARLNQKQKTNFAIYSEDLTPAEWAELFQQLAQDEKKGPQFDRLTVNGLTPADMAKTLGGESAQYQQPAHKGPLGVDITQDPSASTGSQITQSLPGQGGTPKADPANAPQRQAVMVPYNLPQPGFSREVRYLVENRKGWRPGAVQVMLVLWNSN